MTQRSQRESVTRRLREAGCVYPAQEARLLLAATDDQARLEAMIDERVRGLPLEHVIGWTTFAGRRIAVHRGVFVPRRRTELLAAEAAKRCPPGGTLLEVCCGSAAVAATVAAAHPGLRTVAADLDPAAVLCARENLGALGTVFEGDLYAPLPPSLRGDVDVIVANAPYVPSAQIATMPTEARDHEPRIALDGGADGLEMQKRVVDGARDWLQGGGSLLIETSGRQAESTRAIVESGGLAARIVRARRLDATVVVGRADQPV